MGLQEIKGLSASEATIYVSLYWGSLMIGRYTDAISVFKLSETTKKIFIALVPVATFFFILLIFKIKGVTGTIDFYNIITCYIPFIIISVLAFYASKDKPARALLLFSLICIALLCISLNSKGELALWSIISLGLYNSIMWPAIFALAIAGLGKYTSQGSSLLIMAILGGALIPPLQGLVADKIGVHHSFVIPIFCYIYLAFYAWKTSGILKAKNIDF